MENGSFWECVITVSKISAHSVSAGIKHSLYITSLAFLSLFPVAFSSHVSLFGLTALSLHPRSRSATGTLHVGVCEPGSFPFCHPHPLCQQARTLTEASAGAYYWKEHLSERAGAAGGSIAKRGEGGDESVVGITHPTLGHCPQAKLMVRFNSHTHTQTHIRFPKKKAEPSLCIKFSRCIK